MPTPGPLELVIILVIALLILGPGRLPDVGASLGKSIREFRKASSDVQEAVNVNVDTTPIPPAAAAPATAPATAPVAEAPAPVPQTPAPPADPAPASADSSDPTETASARSTNAADSPITAG
jgi:TatA/E family protein of Tat protein translocase